MKYLLLAILFFFGCQKTSEKDTYEMLSKINACNAWLPGPDDARKDILITGDSISGGYLPFISEARPDTDVIRICNLMNTDFTLRKIDEHFAYRAHWDAIIFNNGMWDITNWTRVPPPRYKNQLRQIARKIKARTLNPLYVLTTYVPPKEPWRTNTDVLLYNAMASQVMAEERIPVIDLYTLSTKIKEDMMNFKDENDVHFTDAGYRKLSRPIIEWINGRIDRKNIKSLLAEQKDH